MYEKSALRTFHLLVFALFGASTLSVSARASDAPAEPESRTEPERSPPPVRNDIAGDADFEESNDSQGSPDAFGVSELPERSCVDLGGNYDEDWYCAGGRRTLRTNVSQLASFGFVFGLPLSNEVDSKSTWSLGLQGQATWGVSWAQLGGFLSWSGGGLDTNLRAGQFRVGSRGRLVADWGAVTFYGAASFGTGLDYILEPQSSNPDDPSHFRNTYFYLFGGPGAGMTVRLGPGDRRYKSWILDFGAHHYWVNWLSQDARELPLATRWTEVGVMLGGTLEGLLEEDP